jgi:MFS family permease
MFQAVGPGLITTVFPKEERGKGIGLVVMMVSIGFMVGPPLGGFLLSVTHWSALFLINLPICVVGYFLTQRIFRVLPKPDTHTRVHIIGGVALGLGLSAAMAAMTFMNDFGVFNWYVFVLVAISLTMILLFIRFESNKQTALIGFSIFKNSQFTTSLIAMTTQFIAMAGTQVLIPFYLQTVRGFPTEKMGLFLVIPPAMLLLFAPLAGRLSDKIGYRFLTSTGIIIYIIGLTMLLGLTEDTGGWYIACCMMVIGSGAGIFGTPNASAFMGSVNDQQRPIASSILSSTRNIGLSSGIAISTALFAWLQQQYMQIMPRTQAFMVAYDKVIYVSIIVALVGLPFCLMRQNRTAH